MTPRFFSGRECWVFSAHAVQDLCGHHADLIGRALGDRTPEYLLYSPLRETRHGPFGLVGPYGSHALALAATDLIISRDPHQAHERRTVRIVPLTRLLTISVGEALTLGWLVLRFVVDGQCAFETVFFHSSGIAHFREFVQRWCGRLPAGDTPAVADQRWRAMLRSTPPYLRDQIVPLLRETDTIQWMLSGSEEWAAPIERPRCVAAPVLIVVTDRAMIIAESERPDRPGHLVFGVNVVCVSRSSLTSVRLEPRDPLQPSVSTLSLTVETSGVAATVSVVIGVRSDRVRDQITALKQLLRPNVGVSW